MWRRTRISRDAQVVGSQPAIFEPAASYRGLFSASQWSSQVPTTQPSELGLIPCSRSSSQAARLAIASRCSLAASRWILPLYVVVATQSPSEAR
jgi:hypothetical protein